MESLGLWKKGKKGEIEIREMSREGASVRGSNRQHAKRRKAADTSTKVASPAGHSPIRNKSMGKSDVDT